MRKHLFFFVMLSLCIFGSMVVYPTPAMATVAQSPTIKVRGQVVDGQGEPPSKLKADKAELLPTSTETSNWRFLETPPF